VAKMTGSACGARTSAHQQRVRTFMT
jgi:hypothetical protein